MSPAPDAPLPHAFVVIPALNEERQIGGVIQTVLANAPPSLIEVIVADGGSTDRTREIVGGFSRQDPRVRLIENPRRIQSAGINTAVSLADSRGEVLVRMDAHCTYPATFVTDVLHAMRLREVESVVVRLHTVGDGCFPQAVAHVSNAAMGTGGARHRMGEISGFVEHGHHAAMRRDVFMALGGYDELFQANEDAEFDYRLCSGGGRIWLAADIKVDYFPRRTPAALAIQYFRYGLGRAQNLLRHGQTIRPRQGVPPLLVLYLLACPLLCLISGWAAAPLAIYVAAVLASTAAGVLKRRSRCALGVVVVLPVMHLAWGSGFLLRYVPGRLHALVMREVGQRTRTAGPPPLPLVSRSDISTDQRKYLKSVGV